MLIAFLFAVGIVAMNIHIQMLDAGIPHPREYWNAPPWHGPLRHLVQLMGMAWLFHLLRDRFPLLGYWRTALILFAIMVTLMELTLRLPLTAGYVNGRAFLFTWSAAYLPRILPLLLATVAVAGLSSVGLDGRRKQIFLGVGLLVTAIVVWEAFGPLSDRLAATGAQLFRPPNPEDVLAPP